MTTIGHNPCEVSELATADPFEANRQRCVVWAQGRVCPHCGPACRMIEQSQWTREQIADYLDTPIPNSFGEALTDHLELGLIVPHTRWVWKPYAQRPAEHRADFDRLLVSVYHEGVKTPVIVRGGHVLIGQRRVEIAKRLGITTVPVLRIEEDITGYWKHDVERINRHLKPAAGEWTY